MKFLFVLDQVEAPQAANPVLGRRLAAALLCAGHEVHLLEMWDGHTPLPAPPAGAVRHALTFAGEAAMEKALEGGAVGVSPLPVRLARLLRSPAAVGAAFRQFVLHAPHRITATRAELERLDAKYNYDAVCAVCAPYRAAFALEGAQIKAKKLLWQLDPYAANKTYNAPGGYAREEQLLSAMHAALVTPAGLEDYGPGGLLAACRDKIFPAGFPVLEPVPEPAPAAPDGRRHCTFCGTLYKGLREPGPALALFAVLDDPAWALDIVGPGWAAFEGERARAQAALGTRLCTNGPVPRAEAAALEARAEVLLSLGNAMDNQLPSKLFGYFATGKPVLHLAASERDPALPYLQKYPLALVLPAGGDMAAQAEALRGWLDKVAGQRVPFEAVAALYPAFTPAGVAEIFLSAI